MTSALILMNRSEACNNPDIICHPVIYLLPLEIRVLVAPDMQETRDETD